MQLVCIPFYRLLRNLRLHNDVVFVCVCNKLLIEFVGSGYRVFVIFFCAFTHFPFAFVSLCAGFLCAVVVMLFKMRKFIIISFVLFWSIRKLRYVRRHQRFVDVREKKN